MNPLQLFSRRALACAALWMASAGLGAVAATTTSAASQMASSAPSAASSPPPHAGEAPNDGSDYVAGWTVMGEICEAKYPQMKPAIDEFWNTRWNQPTREKVAQMRRSPDFHAKLARHRTNLAERRDEILAQCGRLFLGGAH